MAKAKTTTKKSGEKKVIVNGYDVTIPKFLRSTNRLLTHAESEALVRPQTVWAPFRDYKNLPPAPPPPVFVTNRAAQVQVNVRTKDHPEALATYANMDAFEAGHDFKSYPVVRSASNAEQIVILVSAKPWAGREAASPKVPRQPRGESKADLIGKLLMRPEGCTTKDILEATGWPSVSVPAQAKMVGLTLRKEKVGKETRYWGSK